VLFGIDNKVAIGLLLETRMKPQTNPETWTALVWTLVEELYSGILLLLGSSKCSKNAVSHEHVTVCSAQQSLCGRKRMADKFYP
jgi:hypothetical protein